MAHMQTRRNQITFFQMCYIIFCVSPASNSKSLGATKKKKGSPPNKESCRAIPRNSRNPDCIQVLTATF